MHMSRQGLIGALVFGAALFFASASAAVAKDMSSSPADRLNVWEGRWKFVSEKKETPFGHAGVETGWGNCAWQPNRTYLVCEYLVEKEDPAEATKPDNLSIFYYSNVDKTYKRLFMAREGGSLEGVTTIDGKTWTVTAEIPRRSGGTAVLRNTYEFVSPDARQVRMKTELSIDKGAHWTELSETTLTKEA